MKIAFFLSGHGFGHAVRNSALIESLPLDVAVDIYTSLPEAFFSDELNRPFQVIQCEIDCGCMQTDTVEVDIAATLARYAQLESRRAEFVSHFAPMLRESGADLIIADTPPLAFPIAKAAGIPAWSICNFTWLDIYAPYVEKHPRYLDMFARMQADYALADRHIRIFPYMIGNDPWPIEKAGMVCRSGRSQREEFAKFYGLNPEKKWGLIYVGSYGLDGVAWNRLHAFSDWEFMGLYPLPDAPANYKFLKKDLSFRYADLNASCDLVLGKLGYGLVAECLAQGKPILFLGRKNFSEFAMLKHEVEFRGLGAEISLDRFLKMDIGEGLESLTASIRDPLPSTGVNDILQKMGF